MTLSGSRGLIRVSKNPECQRQAAMALERVREPDFYRLVTGREFPGEYGERVAARRRGSKFEAALHQNNAAGLRRALAPIFGLSEDQMVVRNFAEEVPGPPDRMRALRLKRTRNILGDLAQERDVPHLLIQPQLQLPTGSGPSQFEFLSPDFMVLDPSARMYVPGEEKSFILRDNVAEPADLDLSRRQAGAQILALRAEVLLVGLGDRVDSRAVFVMATPYGMLPAPPIVEHLDAAIHEVNRALDTIRVVRDRLSTMRHGEQIPLELLFDELPSHYQEECQRTCLMADVCREQHSGRTSILGDDAIALLGDADLRRLRELVGGATPRDAHEADIVAQLRTAGQALGLAPDELATRLA